MIIYLKCEPETCLERINKRNRPEEISMKLSQVQLLNKLHDNWLNNEVEIPVIIINSNLNEQAIISEYDRTIEAIMKLN